VRPTPPPPPRLTIAVAGIMIMLSLVELIPAANQLVSPRVRIVNYRVMPFERYSLGPDGIILGFEWVLPLCV
jgi:hypothetical protein